MKKVLLATTVLALTAPLASAEGLSLSGYGRFGLDYLGDRDEGAAPEENAQINARMRVNIDGSVETDSGITFGGRIRLQYNTGSGSAGLSPAKLYAEASGFRVEVGNVDTAYDSAALMYNSEIGYLDRGLGDPNGDFFSFSSGAYADDRVGLFVGYSAGAFNGRVSVVDPDQADTTTDAGEETEVGLSLDYDFGAFTVSGAYVNNAAGVDGDTGIFLGAEYAISDAANIGLLYFDFDVDATDISDSTRVTLYGNYTIDAITLKAYVANDDADFAYDGTTEYTTSTAYGLGVDYDLGGARLSGDIHRDYTEQTIAGLGVRFDF